MIDVIYFIGWLLSLFILPHAVATTFVGHVTGMLVAREVYVSRYAAINEEAGYLGAAVIPYWILVGLFALFHLDFLGRFVFCYGVSIVLLYYRSILTIKEIHWPNPSRMIKKYTIDGVVTGLFFGSIAAMFDTGKLSPDIIVLVFAFGIGSLGIAKGIASKHSVNR